MGNNKKMILLLMFCLVVSLWQYSLAGLLHDTFYSYPGISFPSENEPEIADTLNIYSSIIIEDIKFFIGASGFSDLPNGLIITVTSPWGRCDTLVTQDSLPPFNQWLDIRNGEETSDSHDDVAGREAQGQWIMKFKRTSGSYPIVLEKWGIEIDSEEISGDPFHSSRFWGYPSSTGMNVISQVSPPRILFTVDQPGNASFTIFDSQGKPVRQYESTFYQPGNYRLRWDMANDSGKSVPSGVYFIQMIVGEGENLQKFADKLTYLK